MQTADLLNNPIVVLLSAGTIILNLLFSGGALFKLIDLARDYGAVKEKVLTQGEEIEKLREFTHELRNGRIPVAVHSTIHHKGGT